MDRAAWARWTDPDTVARRAAGRRHYNAVRNFRQFWRRMLILRMSPNLGALIRRSGEQQRLAAELGVSPSTICRDVKAILEMGYPCPTCGHFRPRPKTLPEVQAELLGQLGLDEEVSAPRRPAAELKSGECAEV